MKKFCMTLVLILIILTSQAQTKYFMSTRVNYKMEPFDWTSWKSSSIEISINPTIRCIKIFSKVPQIINYEVLSKTITSTYNLYVGNGLDSNHKVIGITFQIFNNGIFYLIIEYKNFAYVYDIVEIDVN